MRDAERKVPSLMSAPTCFHQGVPTLRGFVIEQTDQTSSSHLANSVTISCPRRCVQLSLFVFSSPA